MKNILIILKENRLVSFIVAICIICIIIFTIIVAKNIQTETIVLESSGYSFDEEGEVAFQPGYEYSSKLGHTKSSINNNDIDTGAPLIYDNGSIILVEPAIIAFPDNEQVIETDEYTEITKENNGYSIYDDGDQIVYSSSMMIKTMSDYYINLGSNISFKSKDQAVFKSDMIVTQVSNNGTVTLFGLENKNYLLQDITLDSGVGIFSFADLVYDAKYVTDFNSLSFGDADIEIKQSNNSKNNNSNENSDVNNNQSTESNPHSTDSSNVESSTTTNNEENTTIVQTEINDQTNNNSEPIDGPLVTGVNDFLDYVNNSGEIQSPKIDATLTSNFSSIQVLPEVYDPYELMTDEISIYLYNQAGGLEQIIQTDDFTKAVEFNTLEEQSIYNIEIEGTYKNADGKNVTETFFKSSIRTTGFNIDIQVTKQSINSININVKIDNTQNVNSGNLNVYTIIDGVNEPVDTYEINVEEALTDEGQDIIIDNLESNSNIIIEVADLIVSGSEIDVEQTIITQTLKDSVDIQTPDVAIDMLNSSFSVLSKNIEDKDSSIESIEYQMYEQLPTGELEPVNSISKSGNNLDDPAIFYIDDNKITRETVYVFRSVVKGDNNINKFEVTTDYTQGFAINTLKPATADIININTLPNGMTSDIIINDPDKTVIPDTASVKIYMGSEVVAEEQLNEDINNKFEITDLYSDTTYNISIHADLDLGYGNTFYDVIIGETAFTTTVYEDIDVTLDPLDPDCNAATNCITTNSANVNLQFDGDLEEIESAEFELISNELGNTIIRDDLKVDEIENIKKNSNLNLNFTELESNTQYIVNILGVTDGVNEMPTNMIDNSFITMKINPTYRGYNLSYLEDELLLNISDGYITDVDDAFVNYQYDLYTSDASGNKIDFINSYEETNIDNLSTDIIVDGQVVQKGYYYTVDVFLEYNNGYYDENISMGQTNTVKVEELMPEVITSDFVISDNSITFDIIINDEDNVVPDGKVTLELFNENDNIDSKEITVGQEQTIIFDKLSPKTEYRLNINTDLNNMDEDKDENILDINLNTEASSTDIPIFDTFTIDKEQETLKLLYEYTISGNQNNILGVEIEMIDKDNEELIYSYDTESKVSSNGDFFYNIPEIYKNMDYLINATIYYNDYSFSEIEDGQSYLINESDGNKYMNFNDFVSSETADQNSISSIATLEESGDGYHIKTTDGYLYFNNSYLNSSAVIDKAETFIFEYKDGGYYIQDHLGNYLKYDAGNKRYTITDNIDYAYQFEFLAINKQKSETINMNIEEATLPTYYENSSDLGEESIKLQYKISDPSKIVNAPIVYEFKKTDSETSIESGQVKENQTNNITFDELDSYTEYELIFTTKINNQEKGSEDIDYTIKSDVYKTLPKDLSIETISPTFNASTREINLNFKLIDDLGVVTKYKLDIYDEDDKIIGTDEGNYGDISPTHIKYNLNDEVVQDLNVNESYYFELTLSNDDGTASTTATSDLLFLEYNIAEATFPGGAISDETGISGTVNIYDDHSTLLSNITLELREFEDENQSEYTVVGDEVIDREEAYYDYDFKVNKEFTHYNLVAIADIDTDGRCKTESIEIGLEELDSYELIPDLLSIGVDFIDLNTVKIKFIGRNEQKVDKIQIDIFENPGVSNENLIYSSDEQVHEPGVDDIFINIPDLEGYVYKVDATYHYTLLDTTTGTLDASNYFYPNNENNYKLTFQEQLEKHKKASNIDFDQLSKQYQLNKKYE